ncbi:hypothetical protein [Micromonospora chersina]|uniref:hypothetical protein n=1 Tax=Micromonospora chersina TaxID=47854 RepID=UPI00372244A2
MKRKVLPLQVKKRWGPARIAGRLDIPASTCHANLRRARGRCTGRPVRRYEHPNLGDLVHVDVKKLGNIADGGRWRTQGRRRGKLNRTGTLGHTTDRWGGARLGYAFMHTPLEHHSRLAYTDILTGETRETATSFRAPDLLALPNDDEVANLIAMRDLAVERLLPALPSGPVSSGSTFEGSSDLNADADLIVGGVLVDFKSDQGSRPRQVGSRAATLARADLDQLLGHILLDYSDSFTLHTVAIYAMRFGHYTAWPLTDLCTRMAGRPVDLAVLRREFAHLVRAELPAFRRESLVARVRRPAPAT